MIANGAEQTDTARSLASLSLDSLLIASEKNEAIAIKAQWRAFVSQLKSAMKEAGVSNDDMAKRMNVTRSEFDLLITSDGDLVPLGFFHRAANIVGRNIKLELV